ncbi:MAG TPA: hypothetical protein VIX58_00140 [Anaerolineae bacterium]
MFELRLTRGERDLLAEVLDSYLGDLRVQIANTDNFDFRENLKEKERTLARVLVALRQIKEGLLTG